MAFLLRSRDHVQNSASSLERRSLHMQSPFLNLHPRPPHTHSSSLPLPAEKKNQSIGKHSNPKEKGNENVLICPKSPDANVEWAPDIWLELQWNKINDTPVVEGSCPWGWVEIYSICLLSPARAVSYEWNGKDWSGHKFGACCAEEFGAWSIFQKPLEATHHRDMQPTRQIKCRGDFWPEAEPRCSWLTVEGYFALVESLQVTFDFPSAADLLLKCPMTPLTQPSGKELWKLSYPSFILILITDWLSPQLPGNFSPAANSSRKEKDEETDLPPGRWWPREGERQYNK